MSATATRLISRAAELLPWLMVIGIAYTLAMGVLYFISDPASATTVKRPNLPESNAGQLKRPFNVAQVTSKNLFGKLEAQAEGTTTSQEKVEKTRLPLELHGVFVADEPEESAAIVAQKNKPGKLYAIGEKVPGNAELREVYATHVILRRAGVTEKLEFTTLSDGFVADPMEEEPVTARTGSGLSGRGTFRDPEHTSPSESVADRQPQTVREYIEAYREEWTADPEGVLSELGVSPVASGASSGYRVGNMASSPYLSQSGLKSGDVILSVNGQAVGNVQQDRSQMTSLLAQGSARLEVQRGSRRFYVTASLK